MAGITTAGATGALNEKEYIHKLYDQAGQAQKDILKEGYEESTRQLNGSSQTTQSQTQDYLHRTDVEDTRNAMGYNASPTAGNPGAKAQARLALGNQKQANTTALNRQQQTADQEFQRQRQLLGQQYAAAIRQAQADNDMGRAQALYKAAKEEEEKLRTLREQAAKLMSQKGDNSIYDQIAAGTPVQEAETPSWEGVTANEEAINKIYDAQLESQRIAAQTQRDKALSDLRAQQEQAVRQTDEDLTNAYVAALRQGRNYQEVQNAYGQGSGTAAQAQLARSNDLTARLTELRRLQAEKIAGAQGQGLDIVNAYARQIAEARAAADQQRVKALYEAAAQEEQNRINDQLLVGEAYARNGDYSVLGKLYGLTPEQIALLQRTATPGMPEEPGEDVIGQVEQAEKFTDRDLLEMYKKALSRQQ